MRALAMWRSMRMSLCRGTQRGSAPRGRTRALLLLLAFLYGQAGMLALHARDVQMLGSLCMSASRAAMPVLGDSADSPDTGDGTWATAQVHCAFCQKLGTAPVQAAAANSPPAAPALRVVVAEPGGAVGVAPPLRPPVRGPPGEWSASLRARA